MKRIKVAFIGSGHDHTIWNYRAVKRHSEVFDVVGVYDNDEYNKNIFSAEKHFSMQELLDMPDLDAVIIESGKDTEVDFALRFAKNGTPVFIDKPGSCNYEKYAQLMDIIKEKKLPFGIGYMFRFNPMVKKVIAMAKEGKFGKIFSIEAQMSVVHGDAKRRWLNEFKGGMLFYLGCHLVDVVCSLMGFPEEVLPLSINTTTEEGYGQDYGFAVFRYANGSAFIKSSGSEINGAFRRQIVVSGTEGSVIISPIENSLPGCNDEKNMTAKAKFAFKSESEDPWKNCYRDEESESFARYTPMLLQFAAQVRGEEGYVMPLEYELKLLKTVINACGAENDVMTEKTTK